MVWVKRVATFGLALVAAGSASAQQRQQVTGPVATYWMSAQTATGMAAMGMGGPGAKPDMGAMMGMMMGGGRGRGPQHTLNLQLGSSRKAPGEPTAEHLPPPGLRAGQTLPLLTPRAQPTQPDEEPRMPREFEKPKGKMLIFWGCGEHARPGQPVVIDFAQMQPGKMPPGLEALSRGLGVTPMRGPSPSRNATYGEWPNERTRTNVPSEGSLVGAHQVRGTYTPNINFSLAANQDFLGPLQLATGDGPGGSARLDWRSVPGAQAYLATAMGGGRNDTVVLWTSSEVQASAFAIPDYISPGDLARLVTQKALMGPQVTSCAIPAEVVKAAPEAFVQMAAYGGEANFVYPPRPSDPKVAWNQEWAVKVRYRSTTSAILGMDMGDMGAGQSGGYGDDDGEGQGGRRPPPQQRGSTTGKILRGLGGIGF